MYHCDAVIAVDSGHADDDAADVNDAPASIMLPLL